MNPHINKIFLSDRSNPGNGWTLYNNEFYVKGADGKDLATYQGSELEDWYVWGNDLAGKIRKDKPYYYFKDHLGSVRAIVNDKAQIVAAYDGACPPWRDAWGYPLEGREYNADSLKFKYTGKELDKESLYDYFGARYYDSRIGRWGSVDPLLEKHFDFNPYNYVLDNPLIFYDPNGKQVFLGGESYQESKGLGQYIDINETQSTSQKRFDNKRVRESGLTTTEVGLLDPVEWLSGGVVTLTMRLSASMTMTTTEKLVQHTLRNLEKPLVTNITEAVIETSTEYAFTKLATQLEKKLVEQGSSKIFKDLKSYEKLLKEHTDKLPTLKYKSAVEKQIIKHEKSIQTIKLFIKNKGL